MTELVMELRTVQPEERLIVGVVAPYDETTYLTGDPAGERIRRGAFAKSINERGDRIPLLRNHDRERKLGKSRSFTETPEALIGEFLVNEGEHGDELLADVRRGYLDSLSVGFVPMRRSRDSDGVNVVVEAKLGEVSMVALPAYEGAAMLSVRNAQSLDDLLKPFVNRPHVDLSPIAPTWRR
ncbi:MAG: HK97 family phage prohead protease [Aeromicrobium sp.]